MADSINKLVSESERCREMRKQNQGVGSEVMSSLISAQAKLHETYHKMCHDTVENPSKKNFWNKVKDGNSPGLKRRSSSVGAVFSTSRQEKAKKIRTSMSKKFASTQSSLEKKIAMTKIEIKEAELVGGEEQKTALKEKLESLERELALKTYEYQKEKEVLQFNLDRGFALTKSSGIIPESMAGCIPGMEDFVRVDEDEDEDEGEAAKDGDAGEDAAEKKKKKKKEREEKKLRDVKANRVPTMDDIAQELMDEDLRREKRKFKKKEKETMAALEDIEKKIGEAKDEKAKERYEKEMYRVTLSLTMLRKGFDNVPSELREKYFENLVKYKKLKDTNAEDIRFTRECQMLKMEEDDLNGQFDEFQSQGLDPSESKEMASVEKRLEAIRRKLEREEEVHGRVLEQIQENFEYGVGAEEDDDGFQCIPNSVIAANEKLFQDIQPVINLAKDGRDKIVGTGKYLANSAYSEVRDHPFVTNAKKLKLGGLNFLKSDTSVRDDLLAEFKIKEGYEGITFDSILAKLEENSPSARFIDGISSRDSQGLTPLMHAIRAMKVPENRKFGLKLVIALVEYGAVVTVENRKGQTALTTCAEVLSSEDEALASQIASVLADADNNPLHLDHCDTYGYSALSYSCEGLACVLAEMLLYKGCTMTASVGPNQPEEFTNVFLDLLRAGESGGVGFPKLGKKNKSAGDSQSFNLRRKLISRVFLPRMEQDPSLYDNLNDSEGRTPIMHALLGGSPSIIKLYTDLLQKFTTYETALINKRDFRGMNALMYSVRLGSSTRMEDKKGKKTGKGKNKNDDDDETANTESVYRYLLNKLRDKKVANSRIQKPIDVNGCGILFHSCCVRSAADCVFHEVMADFRWSTWLTERCRVAVLAGRLGMNELRKLSLHPLQPVWAEPTMKPPLLLKGMLDTSKEEAVRKVVAKNNPVNEQQFSPLVVALADNGLDVAATQGLDYLAPRNKFTALSASKASVVINVNPNNVDLPENREEMMREVLGSGNPTILKHIFTRSFSEELWVRYFYKQVLLDFFIYLIFLVMQSAAVLLKVNGANNGGDESLDLGFMYLFQVPVVVIFVYLVLQEVLEFRSLGFIEYFENASNFFDIFTYILITIELLTLWTSAPYWEELASAALLCSWMRLLNYLLRFRVTGVFVIIIFKMIQGTQSFVIVLAFFFAAFGFSFFVLLVGYDGYTDSIETFMTMFRAFVGDFDYGVIAENGGLVGRGLFIAFCFLVSTLLLNLLVAVMMSAYTESYDGASILQVDLRCQAIVREFLVSGDKVLARRMKDLLGVTWSEPIKCFLNDYSVDDEAGDGNDDDEDPEEQYLESIANNVDDIARKEMRIVKGFQNRILDDKEGHNTIRRITDEDVENEDALLSRCKAMDRLYEVLAEKRSKL